MRCYPAPNKEEAQTQNPTQGPAAKSRPSEPTSSQREKTARGISLIQGTLPPICPAGNEGDPGGAETEDELRAEKQG